MIPTYQNSRLADQLYQAAKEAGAKDIPRVVAGIEMACAKGEDVDAMLESLRKWQPRLFHRIRPEYERKDQEETRQDQREYRRRR